MATTESAKKGTKKENKPKNIYEKLLIVQKELKAPKGQWNNFGGYYYRNCEDILESLKPILNDLGLIILIKDEVIVIGDRYYVKAIVRLIDTDSKEEIENVAYAREEENKKGQDGSQITGSSSSYARKYALNGMFAIDDTKDSDTTNKHGKDEEEEKENKSNNNDNSKTLSEKQINRLYAIAYNAGYDGNKISSYIYAKYSKEAKNLTKEEYDYVCKSLENKKSEKTI